MSEAPTPDTTGGLTAPRVQHVDAAKSSAVQEAKTVNVAEKPATLRSKSRMAQLTPADVEPRWSLPHNKPKVRFELRKIDSDLTD